MSIISIINGTNSNERMLFWIIATITMASILISTVSYNPLPLALPIGMLFLYFTILYPKHLFYLFFAILPFSIEVEFGSLGTDLPTEPMMVMLLGVAVIWIVTRTSELDKRLWVHPISLVVVAHLAWIVFTSFFSSYPIVSWKYFLAKLWYVVPFYFLPLMLFKGETGIRKIFSILTPFLFVAIIYVLARHAASDFSFASANHVMRPIFRNHVNYAIMLLAFLPYYVYLIRTNTGTSTWLKYMGLGLLLMAIYFSFTRAAQMAVLLAYAFYWVVRWRLLKIALCAGLLAITLFIAFVSVENNYMQHAPEFEKAITHKKFDNLVEATTKMQDVSTVERFYRWIAGGYMVDAKPLIGFGPATFFNNYKTYTVTSYKTYVSDNPERSGIHNNYLMIAAEQGLPGLFIMLLMAFLPLLYAEQAYHQSETEKNKALLMAAATCHFLISLTILINDLLEADKIGPFYFLSAAIIVIISVQPEKDSRYPASA